MEGQMNLGSSASLASLPGTTAAKEEKEEKKTLGPEAPEHRDLFVRAQRRKLSDERKSVTHKFSVGSHEGYLIVGMYEDGMPGEIFIKMSEEGSTLSGFMDGLAISISIGLQYGVPLKTLVDKLTNTRFEPSGFTQNPQIRYASSVLDYIARWLGGRFISLDYLKPGTAPADAANAKSHQVSDHLAETADAPSCSTCGMLMSPNGSCFKCMNCGGTSGCS